MNEQQFWQLIDAAWADTPELDVLRKETLITNDIAAIEELVNALAGIVTGNYAKHLFLLDKQALTGFIHILEERLFHIDRAAIHQYTEGSDDGFLYCRFFIVGMGKDYYLLIDKDPSLATMDAQAETFGFTAYDVYAEKFGEPFERNSIHNTESSSNPAGGW